MSRILNRLVIVAWVSLLCGTAPGAAYADTAPVQGSAGAPSGSAPPAPAGFEVSCKKPTAGQPRAPDHGPISVSVNSATAWQPRGGEVLIAVEGDPASFSGLSYKACFGWSDADAQDFFSAKNLNAVTWFHGFVEGRPSNTSGTLNLGVIVPSLDLAPSEFYQRWALQARSSGLGLVPVAALRLIAYTKDGVVFDEVRAIGITNVPMALLVAAGTLVIAVMILYRLSVAPRQQTGQETRVQRRARILKAIISPDWILTLIETPDGRASLSAFQILLWTLVVAVSAVYVMALSGNLINLTPGTLALLGIAGAAGLIAAYTDAPQTTARTGADATGATGANGTGATGTTGATGSGPAGATEAAPPGATGATGANGPDPAGATAAAPTGATGAAGTNGPAPATATAPTGAVGPTGNGSAGNGATDAGVTTGSTGPQWRDLILDPDTKAPDISRTQMLLFTVVSAAFVVMQVVNYYVIPDIPAGYQILIGLSNGVYVGRKFKGKA